MEEGAPKLLMYTKILAINWIDQEVTIGLDTEYHSQNALTHFCDLVFTHYQRKLSYDRIGGWSS